MHGDLSETTVEVWKPVVGFEGLYEVSDYGNVRSLPTVNRPWYWPRKQGLGRGGYYSLTLFKEGKRHCVFTHVLVLEAFVGPRPGHPRKWHACHGPEGKFRNVVRNLRWDTVANNLLDRVRDGTDNRGERNGSAMLTEEQVRTIKVRLKDYKPGLIAKIAREHNVKHGTISDIHTGRNWCHVSI